MYCQNAILNLPHLISSLYLSTPSIHHNVGRKRYTVCCPLSRNFLQLMWNPVNIVDLVSQDVPVLSGGITMDSASHPINVVMETGSPQTAVIKSDVASH